MQLDPPFNRRVFVRVEGATEAEVVEYDDGAIEAEAAEARIAQLVALLEDRSVNLSVELVLTPDAVALAHARLEALRRRLLDRGVAPERITTRVL